MMYSVDGHSQLQFSGNGECGPFGKGLQHYMPPPLLLPDSAGTLKNLASDRVCLNLGALGSEGMLVR